jgi:serine/threonine protein kinase
VKQYKCTQLDADRTGRPHLPGEIALPVGLTRKGCTNLPKCRTEVYFQCSNPQWRVHLEYCPNGTLEDLIKHYQKLNNRHQKSYYLPEGFIWHAFLGFAMAYHHMSGFRIADLGVDEPEDDHFILHLDLKGANGEWTIQRVEQVLLTINSPVLLGKPDDNSHEIPYPVVKVADWGLAQYTSESDTGNARRFRDWGTICWMPPVRDTRALTLPPSSNGSAS